MDRQEAIKRVMRYANEFDHRIPDEFCSRMKRFHKFNEPWGISSQPIIAASKAKALPHLLDGGLVILHGPVETGKTFAAIVLALLTFSTNDTEIERNGEKEILTQEVDPNPWFCPASLIIDNKFSNQNVPKGMKKGHYIDLLKGCLVVDDLGKSDHIKQEGWSEKAMGDFFIDRSHHSLMTIVTTNLTKRELEERYPDTVYSRFNGEWGRWVYCDGPPLRSGGQKTLKLEGE